MKLLEVYSLDLHVHLFTIYKYSYPGDSDDQTPQTLSLGYLSYKT